MAVTTEIGDNTYDAFVQRIVSAVSGGATCVQLRLKAEPAAVVVEVARMILQRVSVPLLVNDRFDIALAVGAAGVHLGADDVPVASVRRCVPAGFIIGASVGCDAEVVNASGADYVGIGPLFATASKDDAGEAIGTPEFARLRGLVRLPAVAIGGITAQNARAAIDAGAAGVASISAVFGQGDPAHAARALCRATES